MAVVVVTIIVIVIVVVVVGGGGFVCYDVVGCVLLLCRSACVPFNVCNLV